MNFDKLFEKYLRERIGERGEGEPEEFVARMFDRFASEFCPALKASPLNYVKALGDEELIGLLVSQAEEGCVSAITVDETASRRLGGPLHAVIETYENSLLRLTAVEILENTGEEHDLSLYLSLLAEGVDDIELREKLIDILKEHAFEIQEELYERAAGANIYYKTILGEIALSAPRDDRTLKLLLELFGEGENLPLYASYLGVYGDERAAAALYRALDTSSYADFIEIQNAIERLGGAVDPDMRDFTDDPTYRLIKGEGNKPVI